MKEKKVKVGLVGFGTVGCGVAKLILEKADSIAEKTGIRLELGRVVDKDITSQRPVELPEGILTDSVEKLINDDSIDIGVELIGGTTFAKDLQINMLNSGKHVVTANKALLAEFGSELYATAEKNNKCIAFEASCAGGIPIVSAIRTGLAANEIEAMYGIVNGTCNYILSSMDENDTPFDEALSQAQAKGFAEADPTLDINGGDSAHKLAILSSLALGYEIYLEDIYTEGIENTNVMDIKYGKELGYTLKLLAIAEKTKNGKFGLRVHPSFIDNDDALASVNGSFNAISMFGSDVGQIMLYGRGAGMMPTASAVVADIIEVASGNSNNTFKQRHLKQNGEFKSLLEKIGDSVNRYYIRLMVKDQAGVFAQIGRILADRDISISGVIQREDEGPKNTVPVVITTHPNQESKVNAALKDISKLESVCDEPVLIRIVDIPEDKD